MRKVEGCLSTLVSTEVMAGEVSPLVFYHRSFFSVTTMASKWTKRDHDVMRDNYAVTFIVTRDDSPSNNLSYNFPLRTPIWPQKIERSQK